MCAPKSTIEVLSERRRALLHALLALKRVLFIFGGCGGRMAGQQSQQSCPRGGVGVGVGGGGGVTTSWQLRWSPIRLNGTATMIHTMLDPHPHTRVRAHVHV